MVLLWESLKKLWNWFLQIVAPCSVGEVEEKFTSYPTTLYILSLDPRPIHPHTAHSTEYQPELTANPDPEPKYMPGAILVPKSFAEWTGMKNGSKFQSVSGDQWHGVEPRPYAHHWGKVAASGHLGIDDDIDNASSECLQSPLVHPDPCLLCHHWFSLAPKLLHCRWFRPAPKLLHSHRSLAASYFLLFCIFHPGSHPTSTGSF